MTVIDNHIVGRSLEEFLKLVLGHLGDIHGDILCILTTLLPVSCLQRVLKLGPAVMVGVLSEIRELGAAIHNQDLGFGFLWVGSLPILARRVTELQRVVNNVTVGIEALWRFEP